MKRMRNHKPTPKYSMIERIAIGVCLFVCIVALSIIFLVPKTERQIIAVIDKSSINEETQQVNVEEEILPPTEIPREETVLATEAPQEETVPTNTFEKEVLPATEVYPTEDLVPEEENLSLTETYPLEESEDDVEKFETTGIENIEDNIYEWCKMHDCTKNNERNHECLDDDSNDCVIVRLYKISDEQGNLYIALKNEEEEILATFKYEGIITNNHYDDWVLCDNFFEQYSIRDIMDYSFTAYHEVSGNCPKCVQSLICVSIHRQKFIKYPDSIRKVITDPGQFSSAKCVKYRILKGDGNSIERDDLEKCFKETLLVLSGELIREVPSNVVYAATSSKGSGVWDECHGTYFCYY